MRIKIILLGIILGLEIFIFKVWLACHILHESFHFSPYDSQLKLEEAARNDVGYSTYVVRYFHNKISVHGVELLNRYFHFWNTNFDALFFSIVGCLGIAYGLFYLVISKGKKYLKLGIIVILLLLPFIQIFNVSIPFWVKLTILTFPYYLFSLFGLWQFMKQYKQRGVIIVVILLLLSIWYFLIFQKDIFAQFCYNK